MNSAIQFVTPPNPTVTPAAGPAPVEPTPRKDKTAKRDPDLSDMRLVIEESENGVGFIYKTLDRRTGEVLQVFPREDILKMRERQDYVPGSVIDQRT